MLASTFWAFLVALWALTSFVSAQTTVGSDEFCPALDGQNYTHPDGAIYGVLCREDWNGTDVIATGLGEYPIDNMTFCVNLCEVKYASSCEFVNYRPAWGGYTPTCWPRRGPRNIVGTPPDRDMAYKIQAGVVDPAAISSAASASRASVLSARSVSDSSLSEMRASSMSVRLARSSAYQASRSSVLALKSSVAASPELPYRYFSCYIWSVTGSPLGIYAGTYPKLSLQYCANKCVRHPYFGVVKGNQCWCGNTIITGAYPAPEEWCWDGYSYPCPGNTNEICGGDSGVAIYGAFWKINTCSALPPSPAPGCSTLTATRAVPPTTTTTTSPPPAVAMKVKNAAGPVKTTTTTTLGKVNPEPAELVDDAEGEPEPTITAVPGSKKAVTESKKRAVIHAE